ncbi:MAG TPA: substrate-binding domain-containing protein [Chryseosolibacter sp.]|jgi:phosphate transport system substrate-binding protein|nr:substrate-binding domain-containing protein [Chryseosolibacter sp.]
MKKWLIIPFSVLLFLIGCTQRDKHGNILDTPTSGSVKIAVDESLRPLIEAEISTFEALYQQAHIEPFYYPEAEAIDALIKDSVRLAIVTRRFTTEEKKYFKDIQITPKERDVAMSAVALIVHRDNPDTLINMDQIKSLLQGKITKWSELGSKNKAGIEIVFDNPNSGLIRHLKDSVARVQTLPPNCFAVKNNTAVIDYVSENKNALGLIGLEWISDKDDSTSNSFLKRVRVMGVAGDSTHFKPYQAYLALKYYPLARKITILSREARSGLGSGFMVFVASEKGQRIVLKAGLVPVTMPLRVVEIDRSPFEIEK